MKKHEIKELVEGWQKEGVITGEQASRMLEDANQYASDKSSMKLVNVISTVGGLALGVGLLLLIASNWSAFDRTVKLIFALLLPVVPLLVAYYFMVVRGSKRAIIRAANIVGILLIGGALALIGQIYHLESDMLMFFLYWTALSVPFVFAFQKGENTFLTLVLLGVTIFFMFVELLGGRYSDEALLFVIMTIVYLLYAYLAYRIGGALRHHEVWGESGRVMRLAAGVVSTAILFITTFIFYAEMVVDAFGWDRSFEMPLSIFLNIFYIIFLLFVLVRAYQHEEDSAATMVIRWFGIYIIVKYVTLFSDMLDTGIFFVVGGIIFIAGGWFLEHKRHAVTAYLKKSFVPEKIGPTRAFTEPEREAPTPDVTPRAPEAPAVPTEDASIEEIRKKYE